jgi:hypothetical protein
MSADLISSRRPPAWRPWALARVVKFPLWWAEQNVRTKGRPKKCRIPRPCPASVNLHLLISWIMCTLLASCIQSGSSFCFLLQPAPNKPNLYLNESSPRVCKNATKCRGGRAGVSHSVREGERRLGEGENKETIFAQHSGLFSATQVVRFTN